MKRKLLIAAVLIVLALLAASGFIVSAVTVARIESALAQPLQLGALILQPGTKIHSRVGYFRSRVTMADAAIESGPSRIDVPEIEVRLDGGKLFLDAAKASGKLVQLGDAQIQIAGFQAVVPYPGLIGSPAELTARLKAESIELATARQHYRFQTSSLDWVRSRTGQGDKMVLEIQNADGSGAGGSVTIRNGSISQTQKPIANGRIETLTRIHLDGVNYKDLENKTEFSGEAEDFELGVTIDGDQETFFPATLWAIEPGENAFSLYWAKFHPTIDSLSATGSNLTLRSEQATAACANFHLESDTQLRDPWVDSRFDATLKAFRLSGNGSRLEVEAMTWKSTASVDELRQNELIRLLSKQPLPSEQEILNKTYDLFDDYRLNAGWSMTGLAISENNEDPPIRLAAITLDAAIVFESGVGGLSISPRIDCTEPNSWPQLAALKLPVESLGAGCDLALERINARALRPLLLNDETPESQTRVANADRALREFAAAKPRARMAFDLAGEDGPALGLAFALELDRDLPKDFTLAPVFQEDAELGQVLGAAVETSGSLRWNLKIDQYRKLLAWWDQMEGPGAGEKLLEQITEFVKIDGERLVSELIIRDQTALLNGEPNPLLLFLINQLLFGAP